MGLCQNRINMQVAGLLVVVFMVGALGGWFGASRALNEGLGPSASRSIRAQIEEIDLRLETLESQTIEGAGTAEGESSDAEPSPDEIQAVLDHLEQQNTVMDTSAESEVGDWDRSQREWFDARFDRGVIAFTDQEGRTVDANLVAATQESVDIIRVADNRKFSIPIDRLVASDQEFIQYLIEVGRLSETKKTDSKEIDWDSIFND